MSIGVAQPTRPTRTGVPVVPGLEPGALHCYSTAMSTARHWRQEDEHDRAAATAHRRVQQFGGEITRRSATHRELTRAGAL